MLVTLNEAASGNFAARARIEKENMLFRVGHAVNTLLARLQSFRAERAELEKTRRVADILATTIRDKQPIPWKGWTGTCLDPLIMQIQSPTSDASQSQQQKTSLTRISSSSRGRVVETK